jgi:hypothetical protein
VVKTLLAAVILLFATVVPAMAQDDFPRLQMGFGYANLTLPEITPIESGHHSGFTSQFNFNFTKNVGFDYYMGYYGLGNGFELFTNLFGGKLQLPTEKATPYVIAAIGRGNFLYSQGGQSFGLGGGAAARLGGGVDYKLSDSFFWRTEITRLQIHAGDNWVGKANIATGVVFTVLQ